MRYRSTATLALATVLLAGTTTASAEVIDLPGTFAPAAAYEEPQSAGSSFWLTAIPEGAGRRAIRYADGALSASEHPIAPYEQVRAGTPEGGAVIGTLGSTPCAIERRSAGFALQWRVRLAGQCGEVAPSGSVVWATVGRGLVRIDADGSVWRETPADTSTYRTLLPAPGGEVFVVAPGTDADPFVHVTRVGGDGAVRWRAAPIPRQSNAVARLRDDGIVIVTNGFAQGTGDSYVMTALRSSDGSLEYSRAIAGRLFGSAAGLRRDWAIERVEGAYRVRSFARDGSDAVAPLNLDCFDCALLPLAAGSAIVVANGPTGVRIADDGVSVVPVAAPLKPRITTRLADGTQVLLAGDPARRSPVLFRLLADGTFVQLGTPPDPVAPTGAQAADFGDDGTLSLLQSDRANGRPAWSYHDARGALLWASRFDGDIAEFRSSIGAGAVCAAWSTEPAGTGTRVACRDVATGALRWERAIVADVNAVFGPLVRVYADGSVTVAVQLIPSAGSGGLVLRFDANGSELSRITTPSPAIALTAAGTILERERLIRPDGSVLLTLANGSAIAGDRPGDAFAAIRSVEGSRYEIRQFDALGALRSTTFADDVPQFAQFVAGSHGMLIVEPRPSGTGPLGIRYSPADGSAGWRRAVDALGTANARALPGGDVAIFSVGTSGVRIHVVSGGDGSDRVFTDEACRACGSELFPAPLSNGLLRAVSTGTGFAPRLVLAAPTETRLAPDARSISGAWFPPALAGEGLVATFDPSSSTLFAAWFTYASPFTAGEAGLRWYSVQGSANASGTSELTIYENRDGAFARPPVTTAVAVGLATLRLIDCNRAELDYEFDGAPPVRGRRTLARLTDPGRCGATAPAPRAGVDWRQSGAWFERATAGQGVLFSIAPDAPVFGAWFTYDVAGRGDDPAQQQWLTLQSAGVPASGTNIALDVDRTVGGEFGELPAASTTRIGNATLTVDGCSSATLSWQFDASRAAGALSGVSGQQSLERLGTCPP